MTGRAGFDGFGGRGVLSRVATRAASRAAVRGVLWRNIPVAIEAGGRLRLRVVVGVMTREADIALRVRGDGRHVPLRDSMTMQAIRRGRR